jgi:hypothetical protein
MRLVAFALALGAVVLLLPAAIYVRAQRDPENRSTAKTYLVPGLVVLALAAAFAALWVWRHYA